MLGPTTKAFSIAALTIIAACSSTPSFDESEKFRVGMLEMRECTAVQRDLSKPFTRTNYWCDTGISRPDHAVVVLSDGLIIEPNVDN